MSNVPRRSSLSDSAPVADGLPVGHLAARPVGGVDGGRLLRAGLLAGVGALVIKLLLTGQMVKYMSPGLDPLTGAAAVVVLLMAAVELWRAGPGAARATATDDHPTRPAHEHHDNHDHAHEHGEGHDHAHGGGEQALTSLLLGGTLLLGLLFTPRALTSAALGGEDLAGYLLAIDPPAATRPAAGAALAQPIADMTELIATVRASGEGAVGQPVSVIGLVTPSGGLQPGEFAIMRYSVVHCVADARPFGLLISGALAAPPTSRWVRVEGYLAVRPRQGARLLVIEATAVTLVDEPSNPYIPPPF